MLVNVCIYRSETSEKASKTKGMKWGLSFAKNRKQSSKGVMEGAPLTQEGICQAYQLIEFLKQDESKSKLKTFYQKHLLHVWFNFQTSCKRVFSEEPAN
jgi:hypothetical protein